MPATVGYPVVLTPRVAQAIERRDAVVALESSVFAQGLPDPANRDAAAKMLSAVERARAVPAIAAVLGGHCVLGLEGEDLARFLNRTGVRKISARDIPAAVAAGVDGATTVAAAVVLARLAGINVFATGGIGGVHLRAGDGPVDESADLSELARTPVVVVCAGAKSILDLPATWERLESLGIPVIGYRTRELPGFFTARTGIPLSDSVDTADDIARIFRIHRALRRRQAVVVVQAPPAEHSVPAAAADAAVRAALEEVQRRRVTGAAVTPFLLGAIGRLTGGRSEEANVALLEQNAFLAAEIAVALRTTSHHAE